MVKAGQADGRPILIGDLVAQGVLSIQNGYAQGKHNTSGTGPPHLRPFNVSNDGLIDLSKIKYVEAPAKDAPYWLRPNDVIFNNTNSEELVGKTALFTATGDFVLSNHMTIVRVLDTSILDPFWLARYFHYLWRSGVFYGLCRRHVNQASVGLERLRGLQLVLPALADQQAVARTLDEMEQSRNATESVVAAARELKLSAMHHLFTYGPCAVGNVDQIALKDTEIGLMPETWKMLPLKEVASIGYGIQAAVAHLKDPSKGTPILTNINITSEGSIDLTTIRYYNVPADRRDRFILRKGDVLFNWRSGSQQHVGKSALFMLDGEYTHSSFILRIRCGGDLRPEFLAYYLHFLRSCGFFARNRQQSSVNSVFNKSISETIPVMLPPLGVQGAIVDLLDAIDKKLLAEGMRLRALRLIYNTALDSLMTESQRAVEPSHV